MRFYFIHVDGRPYLGEDPDRTIPANVGGEGWQVSNHQAVNELVFGEKGQDPKVITGERGLRSEVDRIVTRITLGALDCKRIEIEVMK